MHIEGEYIALWAHLEALERPPEAKIDDLLTVLKKALKTNPNSERANLYLAQLLLKNGQNSEAKQHFQKVIDVNPRNIEAARELRIIAMRKKRGSDRPSGFFKRFFKS